MTLAARGGDCRTLLASTTLLACGDDGLGTSAVTAADAEGPCRQGCEHSGECSTNPDFDLDECVADCVDDVAGKFRGDAFEAFAACFAEASCEFDEGECLTTCEPLAEHEAFETACRAKLAECGADAEADEICEVTPSTSGDLEDQGLFCLIAPDIIEEMTACFGNDDPCDNALACVVAVGEDHGIDL